MTPGGQWWITDAFPDKHTLAAHDVHLEREPPPVLGAGHKHTR